MAAYAPLRLYAGCQPLASWESVRTMGPVAESSPSILFTRAYRLAALFKLCDFDMGDLNRCLGSVYSHDYIPMCPIRAAAMALQHHLRRPGYPTQDYTRYLHILEYRSPTSASYLCLRANLIYRNLYDNHASIVAHSPTVLAKVVTGAVNHFLLVFLRWI